MEGLGRSEATQLCAGIDDRWCIFLGSRTSVSGRICGSMRATSVVAHCHASVPETLEPGIALRPEMFACADATIRSSALWLRTVARSCHHLRSGRCR